MRWVSWGVTSVHDAWSLEAVLQLLKISYDLLLISHLYIIPFDVNALHMVKDLTDELHLLFEVLEVPCLNSLEELLFVIGLCACAILCGFLPNERVDATMELLDLALKGLNFLLSLFVTRWLDCELMFGLLQLGFEGLDFVICFKKLWSSLKELSLNFMKFLFIKLFLPLLSRQCLIHA